MNYHLITIYPLQLQTLHTRDELVVWLNDIDWWKGSFGKETVAWWDRNVKLVVDRGIW